MRVDVKDKQSKCHLIATVAAALIVWVALLISSPFIAQDRGVADASVETLPSAASQGIGAALLEPALRSLDGVTQHG